MHKSYSVILAIAAFELAVAVIVVILIVI
ncbi:hypothetical protein AHIS1_p007 [Acaryochloris phage A-HIS1]|nr:hypothetical protein AHIS1_p007 [Acaryochloris phage A-HIS1]